MITKDDNWWLDDAGSEAQVNNLQMHIIPNRWAVPLTLEVPIETSFEEVVEKDIEKVVEEVAGEVVEGCQERSREKEASIDALVRQLPLQAEARLYFQQMSAMITDHRLYGTRGKHSQPVPTTTAAVKEVSLLRDVLGCSTTTDAALQGHDSRLVEPHVPTPEAVDKIREMFQATAPDWALAWEDTQERWKQALLPRRMQSSRPNEPAMQNLRYELPRSLGLVGTQLTDVPNWKDDPPHLSVAPEVEAQHRRDIAAATERLDALFARLNNEYDNLKTDK